MTGLVRLLFRPGQPRPEVAPVEAGSFGIEAIDELVGGVATEIVALTRIFHGSGVEGCRAFVEQDAAGLDLPENLPVMEAARLAGVADLSPLCGPVVVLIGDSEALSAVEAE